MPVQTLALGFGIYVVVFALMFLLCLPLIDAHHREGHDIAPRLWKIALLNLPASAIITAALVFFLL